MEERFHNRLKAKMKEKGLSQRQLSLKTGISEAAICRYLSGVRTPHLDVISRISSALDVTADYLLGIGNSADEHFSIIQKAINEHKSYLSSEERMALIMRLSEK